MIWILIFLLFFLFLFFLMKHKDFFYPNVIFNLVWFVVLLLNELKLSTLQRDLSDRTVLIFFTAIASFNIMNLFFAKRSFAYNKKNIDSEKIKNEKVRNIKEKTKIAKLIVMVIFVVEVIYSGGFPLLWNFIGSSKTYFDFGIPSLTGAFYGLVICLGAYSLFNNKKDFVLYFAIGILVLSKQIILSMIIEGIIYGIYVGRLRLTFKKVAIIGAVLLVGFSILGNIRSGTSEIDNVFHAKAEYENIYQPVKWAYSYLTFSVSNFDILANMSNGGTNYGASTLKEFLPTVITNSLNIKENYSPYYRVLINFNVSTYLPSLYLDFGIIGIAIFNAIIGFFGIKFYNRLKNYKSPKVALYYAIFVHNIIFLSFTNMFIYLPIMVQFLYVYIIFTEKNYEK